MASTNVQEDRSKLEKEISEASKNFQDLIISNEEIDNENKAKDVRITNREIEMKEIAEKNKSELSQLDMEQTFFEEKYDYEIEFESTYLDRLIGQCKRLIFLEKENKQLQSSINNSRTKIDDEGYSHAMAMHSTNRDMRIARGRMESTLRRELMSMDLAYQRRAFAALDDRKKKAMLRSSKLKDEISLQGIGMANLSTRLIVQESGFHRCMSDIKIMKAKHRDQRTKLGMLAKLKTGQERILDDLTQDYEKLLSERRELSKSLSTFPDVPLVEKSLASCIEKLFNERLSTDLATKRLELFQNLDLFLKPTNEEELRGFFDSSTFSFESFLFSMLGEETFTNNNNNKSDLKFLSTKEKDDINDFLNDDTNSESQNNLENLETTSEFNITNTNTTISNHVNDQASQESIFPQLRELSKIDFEFSQIFNGLKGKKSKLLQGKNDETNDQNMTAWIATKILQIWKLTSQENNKRNVYSKHKEKVLLNCLGKIRNESDEFVECSLHARRSYHNELLESLTVEEEASIQVEFASKSISDISSMLLPQANIYSATATANNSPINSAAFLDHTSPTAVSITDGLNRQLSFSRVLNYSEEDEKSVADADAYYPDTYVDTDDTHDREIEDLWDKIFDYKHEETVTADSNEPTHWFAKPRPPNRYPVEAIPHSPHTNPNNGSKVPPLRSTGAGSKDVKDFPDDTLLRNSKIRTLKVNLQIEPSISFSHSSISSFHSHGRSQSPMMTDKQGETTWSSASYLDASISEGGSGRDRRTMLSAPRSGGLDSITKTSSSANTASSSKDEIRKRKKFLPKNAKDPFIKEYTLVQNSNNFLISSHSGKLSQLAEHF